MGEVSLSEEEKKLSTDLNLLSLKPIIYVFNISEDKLSNKDVQNDLKSDNDNIYICAKLEADLANFDENEQKNYLSELGVEHSGLDKLIRKSYEILGLHTFFSIGLKEVKAWTISKGLTAYEAAGVIHTDFQRGFISAEIINFADLKAFESVKKAKERGLVRLEGKEYIVRDGDVILFRFNV